MNLRKIKDLNILAVVHRSPSIKRYISIFKYNYNHKNSLGDSSMARIEIDDELKKRLEARSKKNRV